MEFSVPQFIEHAPKIVGPLTWRQFLFIGGAVAIVFILKFFIKVFFVFLLTSVLLLGLAALFAFVQIGGRDVFTVFINFITFSVSSRLYVWQKIRTTPKIVLKKEKIRILKDEIEKRGLLQIGKASKLRDLSMQIETRTK